MKNLPGQHSLAEEEKEEELEPNVGPWKATELASPRKATEQGEEGNQSREQPFDTTYINRRLSIVHHSVLLIE